MLARYETISSRVETELEVSRSRFLTVLDRVETEAEARAVIAGVRDAHPRARHHCTAFVLGPDSRVQRCSDDGEPSGTAGMPMLDALTAAGFSDVVAVVTRYFGGVLLGAAGLTRTYRAAVAGAVAQAPRVLRVLRVEAQVVADYRCAPQIEAEARRRGWAVGPAEYGEAVTLHLYAAPQECDAMSAVVSELSAGRSTVEFGESQFVDA